MNFDFISLTIGVVLGVVIAGAIGRAKFLVVQEELRQARAYAESLGDQLIQRARTITRPKKTTTKGK